MGESISERQLRLMISQSPLKPLHGVPLVSKQELFTAALPKKSKTSLPFQWLDVLSRHFQDLMSCNIDQSFFQSAVCDHIIRPERVTCIEALQKGKN